MRGHGTLEHKVGESLIRTLIAQLDVRITECESLTPKLARYRLRFIRQDYAKLEQLAKRYGFRVA